MSGPGIKDFVEELRSSAVFSKPSNNLSTPGIIHTVIERLAYGAFTRIPSEFEPGPFRLRRVIHCQKYGPCFGNMSLQSLSLQISFAKFCSFIIFRIINTQNESKITPGFMRIYRF